MKDDDNGDDNDDSDDSGDDEKCQSHHSIEYPSTIYSSWQSWTRR